jgi:hypothetical protein
MQVATPGVRQADREAARAGAPSQDAAPHRDEVAEATLEEKPLHQMRVELPAPEDEAQVNTGDGVEEDAAVAVIPAEAMAGTESHRSAHRSG